MDALEKILAEIKERRDFRERLVKYEKENGTIIDVERNNSVLEELTALKKLIRSHMDKDANMPKKRLIDASALDEEVKNLFIAITGNPKQATVVRECKKSFRRIIEEQPTVYAVDGWVPADYPPETNEDVLLCFRNIDLQIVGAFERRRDGSGAYYIRRIGQSSLKCIDGNLFVKGWMPLPGDME